MKIQFIPSLLIILLGFLARILPHPANFAPITAIALFSALYLPRRIALLLPLVAMFLSDLVIGFYLFPIMATVYGSFLMAGCIGLWMRKHKTFAVVLGGTLISSVIFFLATNATVWAFGTMYPHTASGLLQSYTMAIPFFRNSLLGDLFYTGVLVGGMELVLWSSTSSRGALVREGERRSS